MNDRVIVERAEGVTTLTLDRPDKRNALTGPQYAALADALAAAAADGETRVLRLRGAGPDFCAGNDLGGFRDLLEDPDSPLPRFLHAMVDCPLPVVAQVQGNAVGIGTTVLLHCDLVVAAGDARFALPFVPLGLVPEFGSSQLLVEQFGYPTAARLLLFGDAFGADEAQRLGLVAHQCDARALDAVAMAWCRRLAAQPPTALRATLGLLRTEERSAALHATIDRELAAFRERLMSDEHRAALAAFLERRG